MDLLVFDDMFTSENVVVLLDDVTTTKELWCMEELSIEFGDCKLFPPTVDDGGDDVMEETPKSNRRNKCQIQFE